MEKILVIDDDEEIRKLIKDFLQKENFEVDTAKNGRTAIDIVSNSPKTYQLAVLDIMLPDISGVDVCKQIRRFSNIPIIMLTAKSEDVDKIVGLEVGADDYLTKPFNPKELVARIKAILRRSSMLETELEKFQENLKIAGGKVSIFYKISEQQKRRSLKDLTEKLKQTVLRTGQDNLQNTKKIEINSSSRRVLVDGEEIKLTNKEYRILVYFIENKDIVISREKLLENIWGYDFMGESRTIDVHVKELRKKMGDFNGNLIETIWSVGYRFNYDRELNAAMNKK
jgi:two-component system, OmpR family, response regulator ResD